MYVRSYLKRILDTTSRYKYIEHAYANMKNWMTVGDEEERQLKRYLHRHLELPPALHGAREDAEELRTQFAYQYVNSLLTYCSDDLKEGMCLVHLSNPNPHTHCHTLTHRVSHHVRPNDGSVQENPRRQGFTRQCFLSYLPDTFT